MSDTNDSFSRLAEVFEAARGLSRDERSKYLDVSGRDLSVRLSPR